MLLLLPLVVGWTRQPERTKKFNGFFNAQRGPRSKHNDNTDKSVIEYYDLNFDPDDPGATPPVDLCEFCGTGWDEELEIDHPPYDEVDKCFECGDFLMLLRENPDIQERIQTTEEDVMAEEALRELF